MTQAAFFATFLIAISPFVGSFLGVLVDRLPKGQNVIWQRSRCDSCATHLRWFDLIPILSFARQKGRCRVCLVPIPPRLLYIEIAAIGAAVLVVIFTITTLQMVLGAAYSWILLALFFTDLTKFRLPDSLTLALLITGILLAWVAPSRSMTDALIAALIASAVFYLLRFTYIKIRHREGLGLGDVKLIAGIAAGVGLINVPLVVLIASLTAVAGGVVQTTRRGRRVHGQIRLPFGSYLCFATFVIWLVSVQGFRLL